MKKALHLDARETAGIGSAPVNRKNTLSKEVRAWVEKAEAHGKRFVVGEATTKETLEFHLFMPPKLRAALSQSPTGKKYVLDDSAFAILEAIYETHYGRRTPANSQAAALIRIVGKCLKINLEQNFGQLVAAMFNIGKHYETGMPVREESKKTYDTYLRLFALMRDTHRDVPHLFGERNLLAINDGEKTFTRRRNAALKHDPVSSLKDLLERLGVCQLKQALLRWWCEIPGWEPRFGLADFTNPAIGQFCSLIFDPKGKRTDDPFEQTKVKEQIRRRALDLKKRPWIVTGVSIEGKQITLTLKAGQRIPFTRR